MAHATETRIGAARDRAAATKLVLAGAAVGAFGFVLALARISHPAAAQAPAAATTTTQAERQQGDGYGGGSIAPYEQSFDGPSTGTATS